jgi:hypothetical protein
MAKCSSKKEKEKDDKVSSYVMLYEMDRVMKVGPPKGKRPKIAS